MDPSSNFWFPPKICLWCQDWWCTHALRGLRRLVTHTLELSKDSKELPSEWSETGLREQGKKTASTFIVITEWGWDKGVPRARAWVVRTYCQHHRRRQPRFLSAYPDVGQRGHEHDGVGKLPTVRHWRWSQALHYKGSTQISLTSLVLGHHFSSEFPEFGIFCPILLFNFPDI